MRIKSIYNPINYPLSDGLLMFMEMDTRFHESLKLYNRKRFCFLGRINTSHTPKDHPLHYDQVIGLWYFDKEKRWCSRHGGICQFKQDYIVNKGGENKYFVSYAVEGFKNGSTVRSTQEFFAQYGNGEKFYHNGRDWQHHYKNMNDLPDDDLRMRIR